VDAELDMAVSVLVLARMVHLGSAMLLVALPYFMAAVVGPNPAIVHLEGFTRSLRRWLWLALGLEALSGVVWFWFAAAQMCGESPWTLLNADDLKTALEQTQFGHLWVGRAGIGVVSGIALFFVSRREPSSTVAALRGAWLVLVPGVLLLATLAWAGHSGSGNHFHVLHLAVDVLHLLTGAVWPVGLIPLGLFLRHFRAPVPATGDDLAVRVLQRFSRASLIAVLLIVGSGIINGWLMIGSWTALVTTTYGELLLMKVLVVFLMIGLGAVNRLHLLPRLAENAAVWTALRRTVAVESCLAAVVILIVAMMGLTAPP